MFQMQRLYRPPQVDTNQREGWASYLRTVCLTVPDFNAWQEETFHLARRLNPPQTSHAGRSSATRSVVLGPPQPGWTPTHSRLQPLSAVPPQPQRFFQVRNKYKICVIGTGIIYGI